MFDGHFLRVNIINLISASIITFVACYFLKTFNLNDMLYVTNIFGLLFLVIFGIHILVESGYVKNNHERFLLAIGLIIIYDIIFLIFVPMFFGSGFLKVSAFPVSLFGMKFMFPLAVVTYFIIFAAVVLVLNYLLYLRERRIYGVE